MKTFNEFELDEGIMDKLKAVKRGMEARGKAADHFDKAGDPKNPNASKDLRRAVKYHNVVNKEEVVDEGENKQIKGGDPCWKGYQMVGMKPGKGGKKVPNCVPANEEVVDEGGLWANIHAKRKRIASGSGEKMRKPGSKGAPTDAALKASAVKEGLKPGWMLKADPKLGAAVKAKQDLAKKRQASYGNPAAGKSAVKEELKADLKSFRTMLEEASYKVEVDGLPTMYVQSDSPTAVKTNLRKILKKADMIRSVDRIPDVEVKKAFRLKAMGKDEE